MSRWVLDNGSTIRCAFGDKAWGWNVQRNAEKQSELGIVWVKGRVPVATGRLQSERGSSI